MNKWFRSAKDSMEAIMQTPKIIEPFGRLSREMLLINKLEDMSILVTAKSAAL
jgi:hypothetical protein